MKKINTFTALAVCAVIGNVLLYKRESRTVMKLSLDPRAKLLILSPLCTVKTTLCAMPPKIFWKTYKKR